MCKSKPILRLEEVTKVFGDIVAVDKNSISFYRGEVHVLFGENGAGKSTLANMVYGYLKPTSGKIYYEEEEVQFRSPKDASAHGIGMVHQHFMLVPTLTGLKNLLLGLDYGKGPMLSLKQAKEKAQELCELYNLRLNLDVPVWQLSVGEQQSLEILKALFCGSSTLILDEPTAVLTPQEADILMDRILELKNAGVTVILVSHKLKDIRKTADRITVLRRGKLIETVYANEVTDQQLIEMMVGRSYEVHIEISESKVGGPVLVLDNVSANNDFGSPTLDRVSFEVRAGEIFGVAGVSGNGQKELYQVVTAVRETTSGRVIIADRAIRKGMTFKEWRSLDVAEIPEDRVEHGTIGSLSISHNVLFGEEDKACNLKHGVLDWKIINSKAKEKIEHFDVRPPDPAVLVQSLSGGNMQKVVLSRELSRNPKLIVAAQPTRGLDILAVEFIWRHLVRKKEEGVACLLISEDLDELIALCDRICVIYRGRISGIFEGNFPLEQMGRLMISELEDVG